MQKTKATYWIIIVKSGSAYPGIFTILSKLIISIFYEMKLCFENTILRSLKIDYFPYKKGILILILIYRFL